MVQSKRATLERRSCQSPASKTLQDALEASYILRAKLFHSGVAQRRMSELFQEIDVLSTQKLDWTKASLGVSKKAMQRINNLQIAPHEVFVHPQVIGSKPRLIAYYRNLVAISQKGIGQILFATAPYETGKRTELPVDKAEMLACAFNRIMSSVIEAMPDYRLEMSREAALAEIGAELQGTWANMVGQGAAKEVKRIIAEHLMREGLLKEEKQNTCVLTNRWRIVFASEPDVSFRDPQGTVRIAIEIKGSLDKAGAQTRYGESKKSFAKVIRENPRCHTVYLASCFTPAVISQIQADGQVRDWFSLTEIMANQDEKARFLQRLFHVMRTPT